jgi:hypothetical protein
VEAADWGLPYAIGAAPILSLSLRIIGSEAKLTAPLIMSTIQTSDPNRPVTCPLYLFWYTLYLKNYKLTILGNRVKQVGVREGIIFGN